MRAARNELAGRWLRAGCAALAVAAGLLAAEPALASRSAAPASPPARPTSTTPQPTSKGKPEKRPTPGHTSGSAQGIVQSIASGTVVLTQLDGTSVSFAVTPATRLFVDGRHASASGLKPGFVVSARWVAGKARVLQAFDLSSADAVKVGVVRSVSARAVVVRRNDGGTVTIRVGPKTRVLLDGDPAPLHAVKAGYTVVFAGGKANVGKPAAELRFLRPI